MIYTPQQMQKSIAKQETQKRIENYRGKGHNKAPHNKINFSKKRGR